MMTMLRRGVFPAVVLALSSGGAVTAQEDDGATEGAATEARAIDTASLADLDPLTAGVISRAQGAFDANLWAGTDMALAHLAMEAAPRNHSSPAAARLAQRVLMSAGDAPVGDGDRHALARARLDALSGLGQVEAVHTLTAPPEFLSDAAWAERAVEARFALNDSNRACEATDAVDRSEAPGTWARVRAVCLALAGEATAAEVTMDLARERGEDRADGALAALLLRAGGGSGPTPSGAVRDSLEIALALAGDVEIDTESLAELSTVDVAGLALRTDAPLWARLAAARVAATSLSPMAVTELYVSAAEGAGVVPEASLAALTESDDPVAEALRYQRVLNATEPEPKAAAIAEALAQASTYPRFVTAAEVYAAELAFLPVTEETQPHAPAFVEALAVAGQARLARTWLRALQRGAPGAASDGPIALGPSEDEAESEEGPSGALDMAELVALVEAADPGAQSTALADAAIALLRVSSGLDEPVRAAAEDKAAILLALGAEPTPGLRRASRASGATASALEAEQRAELQALTEAAEAGARAETALLAAGLYASAVGQDDLLTERAVIASLRQVGLEADASAFAVEAMVRARRGNE